MDEREKVRLELRDLPGRSVDRLLKDLHGKRIRITVEVLEEGD